MGKKRDWEKSGLERRSSPRLSGKKPNLDGDSSVEGLDELVRRVSSGFSIQKRVFCSNSNNVGLGNDIKNVTSDGLDGEEGANLGSSALSGNVEPGGDLAEKEPILCSVNKKAEFDIGVDFEVISSDTEGNVIRREVIDLTTDDEGTSRISVMFEGDEMLDQGGGGKGEVGGEILGMLGGNTGSERRASSRLKGQKRPFYGSSPRILFGSRKVKNSNEKNKTNGGSSPGLCCAETVEVCDQSSNGGREAAEGEEMMIYINAGDLGREDARLKVKKAARLYNKYYLQFVQEKDQRLQMEEKGNHEKGNNKGTNRLKKKGNSGAEEEGKRLRPDLLAVSKMIQEKRTLYPAKRFGHLPGIEVGHQFFSRAEMVAVGLHGHWLWGIDYMTEAAYGHLKEYKKYDFPLAVSIVLSGMYEDDLDKAEEVVYTGQGGNNLTGNQRQVGDQLMVKGNLALKNNMEQKVPVRVTRRHMSASSYTGKVFTYDGLYKVISYWAEKGISGFNVFKFQLRRIEGQPALTTSQVHFIREVVPSSLSDLQGKVCDDISGHLEKIPVPASNLVDNPPVAPNGYTYCNTIQLAKGLRLPTVETGCSCKGACVDPDKCACAKLNGSDFPYVDKDGGRLIQAKDVVFECGPKCKCGPKCVNRTSQGGLRYRLEVFRTPNKGWAVRSWDSIPSGAPVCEYTGKLMRTADLDNDSGNEFIFEIDCLETMEGLDGRESRGGVVALPSSTALDKSDDKNKESGPEFCINAGSVGGVARFINHSCEPNLFVQCVLSSHHDARLARIVLFAADYIPPMEELTYDYGYALDSVISPDGNIKVMPCYCGAKECRKRMY